MPEPYPLLTKWPPLRPKTRPGTWTLFGSSSNCTEAQKKAARDHVTSIIAARSGNSEILAFTDGSCAGNPGPSGAGAVLELPCGRRVRVSSYVGHATSVAAELFAIRLALLSAESQDTASFSPISNRFWFD